MRLLATFILAGWVAACGGGEVSVNAGTKPEPEPPPKWDDQSGGEAPPLQTVPEEGRAVEGHGDPNAPTATLPGFRLYDDGTSRVFLEVSGSVEVVENKQPNVLRYRFTGVDVPERVNRLALPTTHFTTPVNHIHVEQVGTDADLVIQLRYPVEPKVHLRRNDRGTVISVDFPKHYARSQVSSNDPQVAQ